MKTIGREAKRPVSDADDLKAKLAAAQAENDALKKKVKELEAEKKKDEKANTSAGKGAK